MSVREFAVAGFKLPWGRAVAAATLLACLLGLGARAEDQDLGWEITPESERALELGLEWLAQHQGREGNWNNKELGLVSVGALAFLADGHTPGRGKHGEAVEKALNYVLDRVQPSGTITITNGHRTNYNHGLATFVLGQAYGMTADERLGPTLERALKVIIRNQGPLGGWTYSGKGDHDMSLCVMQAKALRSAVDSGFDVPPSVVKKGISYARRCYVPQGCAKSEPEEVQREHPGQFTYNGGPKASVAMAAAGAVFMQEFAQYDDWRVEKSLDMVEKAVQEQVTRHGPPFDSYTLYYVAQALYQAGGDRWKRCYPLLRDDLLANQNRDRNRPDQYGSFGQKDFWYTSTACFVLAIPNRYLPILQEGKIDSLREKFGPSPAAAE